MYCKVHSAFNWMCLNVLLISKDKTSTLIQSWFGVQTFLINVAVVQAAVLSHCFMKTMTVPRHINSRLSIFGVIFFFTIVILLPFFFLSTDSQSLRSKCIRSGFLNLLKYLGFSFWFNFLKSLIVGYLYVFFHYVF